MATTTDDFEALAAGDDLAGNWTQVFTSDDVLQRGTSGDARIASSTAYGIGVALRNDVTPTDDQSAQIDHVERFQSNAIGWVLVRASGADTTLNGYFLEWTVGSANNARIGKYVNGVKSTLGALLTHAAIGAAVTWRLDAVGTTLEAFMDGVSLGTRTDATYTSGDYGIGFRNWDAFAYGQIDNWVGSDLATGITLTGPSSVTEGTPTSSTGTNLADQNALFLRTTDLASQVEQTITSTSDTALGWTPASGINAAVIGTPVYGVPLVPTVSAAGVTAYQLEQWATQARNFATFDGTDDYIAIDVSATGDWSIEWEDTIGSASSFPRLFGTAAASTTRINLTSTNAINMVFNSVTLLFSNSIYTTDGKLHTRKISKVGNDYTYREDGVDIETKNSAPLAAEDPAFDAIGQSGSGNYTQGIISNCTFTGFTSADGATSPISYALDDGDMVARSNKALGSELWTSPTLAAGWTDGGGGIYTLSGDGSYQPMTIATPTSGNIYLIEFTVDSISGGSMKIQSSGALLTFNTTGTYSLPLAATANLLGFARNSGTIDCVISNISIRNAPAYATYENFELSYSDRERMVLQESGDWLGSELVVNGNFATDSDWTLWTGWSIAGGVASSVAVSNTPITSASVVAVGNSYQTAFTVSDYVSGSVQVQTGGSGVKRTADGTYSEVLSATYSEIYVRADFSSGFIGSIDNVSVKRILQVPT